MVQDGNLVELRKLLCSICLAKLGNEEFSLFQKFNKYCGYESYDIVQKSQMNSFTMIKE